MTWVSILQIIIAILLIASILLQQRGSGLGASFGGESTVFRTKRGVEKSLFQTTIVLSLLFLGSALAGLVL
ncbi:MAG TPA: preprotein translocase subunit SecG [Patescibacteria group bacterium]|nr:preprotein translocase subunit SecG [Patescibacteria group bacterium]